MNVYWVECLGDQFTVYSEGFETVLKVLSDYTDDPLNDIEIIEVYRDIHPGFYFKINCN